MGVPWEQNDMISPAIVIGDNQTGCSTNSIHRIR
jgi:hypothetical protein